MKEKAKKNSKELIKKHTPEEVLELLKTGFTIEGSKEGLLKKLAEDLLPALSKNDKKIQEQVIAKADLLMRICESDHQMGLMETFPDRYRFAVREVVRKITSEYDCKTEIEKGLVSVLVNAHMRYLDNSRRLNNELECKEISQLKNIYIANLSKQTDRAHRQYLSALLTLKQLKAPTIEMNVKATNAFVSQNQQINIPHNEIIEPQ